MARRLPRYRRGLHRYSPLCVLGFSQDLQITKRGIRQPTLRLLYPHSVTRAPAEACGRHTFSHDEKRHTPCTCSIIDATIIIGHQLLGQQRERVQQFDCSVGRERPNYRQQRLAEDHRVSGPEQGQNARLFQRWKD